MAIEAHCSTRIALFRYPQLENENFNLLDITWNTGGQKSSIEKYGKTLAFPRTVCPVQQDFVDFAEFLQKNMQFPNTCYEPISKFQKGRFGL